MRVILFGASGMVGQAVLRECLLDPEVEAVLAVVRRPLDTKDAKLSELVHEDLHDLAPVAGKLTGYDACLFCLGVSSLGMSEADYRHVTYDLTLGAANLVAGPGMTFLYITGAGTDSTEKKRSMWARVKGATENALLALPFKGAYMFRPAYIQPMHGVLARSRWTRVMYRIMGPLYPLWRRLFPRYVTSSDTLARVMLQVAKHGAPKPVIENREIAALLPAR